MHLSTETDEALIQRIVNREDCALEEFRRRFHGVVMATGLRVLHERADAEDVAQDVMTRVWLRAHTYDSRRGSPLNWVVRITRNRSIDVRRCQKERGQVQLHRLVAVSLFDAVERLAIDRDAEAVTAELFLLPTAQRVLLQHAFFDGLSHTELATLSGVPLGTVKSRIRAGLMTLKRRLMCASARRRVPPRAHEHRRADAPNHFDLAVE